LPNRLARLRFDLGRLLIGEIDALFVGAEVLAVSNVDTVPGHHGAPSAGGGARRLSATDARGWLMSVMTIWNEGAMLRAEFLFDQALYGSMELAVER
jgi:hypothetical protein